jgi:hypothetical protein
MLCSFGSRGHRKREIDMSIWTIGANRSLPQAIADFLIEMFRSGVSLQSERPGEPLPDDSRRQLMAHRMERMIGDAGRIHAARRIL